MPDTDLREDDIVLSPSELSKLGRRVIDEDEDEIDLGSMDKAATDWVFDAGWKPLQLRDPATGLYVNADVDLLTAMVSRTPNVEKFRSGFRLKSRDRLVHYDPLDKTKKVSDASGAVEYQGDSQDGTESEEGADESTIFRTTRMADDVDRLVMILNIHKEEGDPQVIQKLTFDQIAKCFARFYPLGKEHLADVFQLTQVAKGADTIVLGYFDRVRDGDGRTVKWTFKKVMQFAYGLAGDRGALGAYGVR